MGLFTDHPADVNETYGEHFGQATSFGSEMILCGLGCLLHGLLPFLFVTAGSKAIRRLNERMLLNRVRNTPRRIVDPHIGHYEI